MAGLRWTSRGPRRECLIVRNGCVLEMEAFFRTRVGWWSVILLFALALESRAAEPRRRVLLLHSFNYSFPATSVIAEAARKRLVERSPSVEIDAEFLDLARNTDPAHALRIATFIRDKYEKRPPDVVITLGSAALPFIVRYRDNIPDVPIVFTSISPQTYAALPMPPKMTGSNYRVRSGEDACACGAASAGSSPPVCHCWKRRDGSPVATDSPQNDRGAWPQVRDDISVRASVFRTCG